MAAPQSAATTDAPPMLQPASFIAPQNLLSLAPSECADERHCVPRAWTDFLAGLKGLSAPAQLEAVNRWANAKPYVEDIANWGLPDYWETPGEFIAHGGDCEDYAIAKYFSLVRLGFAPQDLRIMIVSDSSAHDFHAVLVARLDGTEWLLDNQIADLRPLEAEPQYQAVYGLNEQGWQLYSQPVIQLAGNTIITSAPMARESTSAGMQVARAEGTTAAPSAGDSARRIAAW